MLAYPWTDAGHPCSAHRASPGEPLTCDICACVVISRETCLCGLPYAKVATTTVYASLHRIAVSARVRRIRSGSETQTGVSSWFAGSKNVADTEYEAKKARAAATEAVRSQTP